MSPVTSYSPFREHPLGSSGTGLDQTQGWIARDPGLAGANEAGSISSGIAAADGLNRLIAEGLRDIGALDKAVLTPADIVALNGWFRDPAHPERLQRFLELHGDDENGTETGFHTIQNDGGNRRFDGRALIDTVLDGLYHIGFPLSADGTRLTNEDGDDNATLTDVARWLTLLKRDLATSGSDLDRIVETIVADPGLQASISPVHIAGGAEAANDLNQLILEGITALYERGRADRDDTRLSAAEVTWINGWIQSDPARYAFFVERHGDDENGVETGYHLVQNDGATTQLFGQNAVNTIYDGIYHIGFTINADGRFQNEDGDANARVSDVAEWITYYYGDPSTTGSGLDRLVDWIRLDPGLAKQTSALDINDGLAAANALNGIFLEAVAATDVNLDGWISRNDLRTINRWVRANRYSAFVLHHGDDENGEETGFHKIQNDGATTQFFGQNLVNTVADGIYHYGFEIRGDNFLNEDGDTNQSLSDVSGWVNYFLSNRRLTLGSDNGETIAGNGEAEQVLARGGDDVVDGFGGSDLLDGGWGNDTLRGGVGADVLDGGFGDDNLDGGEDGDTYLASGANPDNPVWQTYSFQGYDSYADSGSSGVDVILAQGAGAVDIGLRQFGPSNGIEQIVNATEGGARVTLLGNWQANVFDFSTVALIGGNFLINPGDGNDTVIGTAVTDVIRGGRGDDSLNGGGGGDTYLVSGYDPAWYNNRPYTFEGYDSYADSGAAGDGIDQILATGSGPVDVGLGGNFSAASGIEQIVNATDASARVTLLGNWQTNNLDFSNVALIGGNIVIDAGDGNDTVIGTAGADVIRGGRGDDSLNGGGGGDTYLVSGYDPAWYNNRPYTFEGYDSYADSGAAGDGIDQIVATGSGPVDIGFSRDFSAASGIERIVNAISLEVSEVALVNPVFIGGAVTLAPFVLPVPQVRLLGNWQVNNFDFSNVALVGGSFLIDAGDGNDTVIGTAGADVIRGGRGDDSLNGGGGGDTYFVSGYDPAWYNNRPYTFEGYDSYADSGAADDGIDQILATGSGPVDVGLGGNFSAASGIEQIVNATDASARVTLLGNWQTNNLDFSNVALIGGNIVIDAGDGNDTVIGTANADLIRGGRGDDSLNGGGGGDTYLVSGYDPAWYNNRPYTFEGYDSYADSGATDDGIDQILATGSGPVDIGLGREFSAASGIEQIVNATDASARVTLLGDWQANVFDFSTVTLIGGNFLINAGDGNDTVIGTAGADVIRGGRGDDSLNGGGGGDSYLVSGYDPAWYNNRPYTFEGYDSYADSGAADDGIDQILATGSGPVDVGLGGNFSAASGIEQIVNATEGSARVTLLGDWQTNNLDFSNVALIGGNIVIDAGDGNDTVIGTAGADLIRGGRGEDSLDGGGGGDTYLVSGYDPAWYNDRPYTFEGYDSYADSGAADDGLDQILATGSGPVDIGLGRDFTAASGIEQIVNATDASARVTLLGDWQTNILDFSNVVLIGGNIVIDAGDGNDTVIGTANADLIRGGRGEDSLDGGGGGDTYLVSGYDPAWYNNRPYTFEGYDTYADSGATDDGIDQILATGSGPVDIGLGREFSAASGIEQIVNATDASARVTLLGDWQTNLFDFSGVSLIGGNFLIDAGDGNDFITGTAAADRIRGGRNDDWLNGGAGNDTYEVSGSDPNWYADRPYTFEGYDTFADSSGYDRIVAVAANGRDNVDIGLMSFGPASGIELIDATGTSGSVRLLGDWQNNSFDFSTTELRGTNLSTDLGSGNDSFIGSAAGETVSGDYGDDWIRGRGGNDSISGGGGNDILDGGEGSDTYWVSGLESGGWQSYGGTDTYSDSGATGVDRIVAIGNDNVDIGLANGNFLTGNGIEQIVNNTSVGGSGGARPGQVRLQGNWAANTLNFSRVRLLGGNVVIDAGDGNDSVTGSADGETILAGQGVDAVNAGAGDDTINGGSGLDTLTGGTGADTFVYTALSDGSVGGSSAARSFERINGFTVGLDRFDVATAPPAGGFKTLGAVSGLNDTALTGLLSATNFVANGAATFSFGSGSALRTFIAFNDASAGYGASGDAVVEISGFSYASGFNSLAQISIV